MDKEDNGGTEKAPGSIESTVIANGTKIAHLNIDQEDLLSRTESVILYEYKSGFFMYDGSSMHFMGTVAYNAVLEYARHPPCKGRGIWLDMEYEYIIDEDDEI